MAATWEKIGEVTPVGSDIERVPDWVRKEITKIFQRDGFREALYKNQYLVLKGRNFEYRLHPEGQAGSYVSIYKREIHKDKSPGLRRRATAVVIRDGKVLLVRDKGKSLYSLPGGGVHRNEPLISAAARELYEETHLTPLSATFIGEYQGQFNIHMVFLVNAMGDVHIHNELDEAIWCERVEDVPRERHVDEILKLLHSKDR